MKTTFATLLIFGFVGVAVFGIFAMGHGMGHEGCIAAAANGKDCRKIPDVSSFLVFHLESFLLFSTAVFGDYFGGSLLLLLLGFTAAASCVSKIRAVQFLQLPGVRAGSRLLYYPILFQPDIISWLSFHETSPTVA